MFVTIDVEILLADVVIVGVSCVIDVSVVADVVDDNSNAVFAEVVIDNVNFIADVVVDIVIDVIADIVVDNVFDVIDRYCR